MKDIDKLIDSAKDINNTEFPFSDDEIRNILDNCEPINPNNSQPLSRRIIKMTTISASIATIIYLALQLFNPNVEIPADIIKNNNIKTENTKEIELPKKQDFAINTTKKNDVSSSSTTLKNDVNSSSTTPTVNIDENIYIDLTCNGYSARDTMDLLILNDEELNKINIAKAEESFAVMTETYYPPIYLKGKDTKKLLEENNYPNKGIIRKLEQIGTRNSSEVSIIPYKNWSMELSAGIFPISSYSFYKGISMATSFGIQPLQPKEQALYRTFNSLNHLFSAFVHKYDNENNPKFYNFVENKGKHYKIIFSPDTLKYAKMLIPIYLSSNKNDTIMNTLMLYPATSNFIKLLPERYSNIKSFDKEFSNLTQKDENDAIRKMFADSKQSIALLLNPDFQVTYTNKPADTADKYNSPKMDGIELTLDELIKLCGYNSNNDIIIPIEEVIDTNYIQSDYIKTLPQEYGYSINNNLFIINSKLTLSKKRNPSSVFDESRTYDLIKYGSDEYKNHPVKFSPFSYLLNHNTSVRGNSQIAYESNTLTTPQIYNLLGESTYYDAKYNLTSNQTFSSENNIIKIRVEWDSSIDTNKYKQILNLWFVADEALIEAMPERYKNSLLKEFNLLKKVIKGEMEPESACTELKTESSYFGLCSMNTNFVKSLKVSPNPLTKGTAKVTFLALEDVKLKFALYDIYGNLKKNFDSYINYQKGYNDFQFEVDTEESGIYILTCTDENKNVIQHKVVINK